MLVSVSCWFACAIKRFANAGAAFSVSITSLTTPTPKECQRLQPSYTKKRVVALLLKSLGVLTYKQKFLPWRKSNNYLCLVYIMTSKIVITEIS